MVVDSPPLELEDGLVFLVLVEDLGDMWLQEASMVAESPLSEERQSLYPALCFLGR